MPHSSKPHGTVASKIRFTNMDGSASGIADWIAVIYCMLPVCLVRVS
jgi:hypothetical protein